MISILNKKERIRTYIIGMHILKMKYLLGSVEGEANMAYQPFYIMNAQNQEENWEALEEKDWEYTKGMYPQMAREIQNKVDEECDKLEYEGSIMFDEYPDKLMMRTICERIYKEIQDGKGREMLYAEDEEEMGNEAELYPENRNISAFMPSASMSANNQESMSLTGEEIESKLTGRVCSSCWRRPPHGGPGFPPPPPHGPGWGSRPPHGGPGFPPPPPHEPGWGPRPPHGGPGFPPPKKRPCSCPPGRPCRDCLIALQSQQPDWMRDMIEVLLYQEMMHRRSRRRRRRQYQRNY